MEFKNRPNFQVTDEVTGEKHWISRSVAVVAIPFFSCGGFVWVPMGVRSDEMPTCPGQWGLPCGFLDWGETAAEAVRREVWEEIGLELSPMDVDPQPDAVMSDPAGDDAQVVSLRFIVRKVVDRLPSLKAGDEVTSVDWFPAFREEAEGGSAELGQSMNLAFNHGELIEWGLHL